MEKKLLSLVYAILLSLGSLFAQNGDWQELGPFDGIATSSWTPGVGRITCVAVDPNNHEIILVGTPRSGLWKTTNGGQDWIPLNDTKKNKSVLSVAIDPNDSNIYYFNAVGAGLSKSTDAGETWTWIPDVELPIPYASNVNSMRSILIHPDNSDIILVAIMDYGEVPSGIYRTLDGGENWELVVADDDPYDIQFKPGNPEVVYASGDGFYRSPDGGASWGLIPGFNDHTKKIAVSPDNPEKVYVLQMDRVGNNNLYGGLFVSDNGGLSFEERDHGQDNYLGPSTTADDPYTKAPLKMTIAANPTNADEVHIGGIITWRSLDSGVTFEVTSDIRIEDATAADIGYCHKDIEKLYFVDSTLYACTDGGLYKAEDTQNINADYFRDIGSGMGIRNLTSLSVAQSADPKILISSRDMGASFYDPSIGWRDWLGKDEGYIWGVLVNSLNEDVFYGFSSQNNFFRTDDGGETYIQLPMPDSPISQQQTLRQDPQDPNTIYVSNNQVFKSNNKGESWMPISPDFQSDIMNFEISSANNQVMYYTSRSGHFMRTLDGGSNWENIYDPTGVIDIALHPTNEEYIAYVGGGPTVGNESMSVQVSYDRGDTWENIVGNLGDDVGWDLVWEGGSDNGLFVSTFTGIYYTNESLGHWVPYMANLPRINISFLEVNYENNMIYAGTQGRGAWVSPMCNGCVLSVDDNQNTAMGISLVPNPTYSHVSIRSKEYGLNGVEILDVTGKMVFQNTRLNAVHDYDLDVSQFKSGIYFVRMNSDFGTVTKRLIKQ
ncbi:T9SS type A sorting domain-containing protein [Aureisphaera galaxeae]|uniref:T9SS type A sorting domain-containing protein n=1 Tax=Aureisphaera galaxeae TaxID=1538023 RepID=UPI00235006EE|nr:T9SS type A sorting domain-containing protein [Aureisphaera galaxeae]MDC8005446.1 T9SS type A sorting domain-containing protein [Aureisphaera galaxeae]